MRWLMTAAAALALAGCLTEGGDGAGPATEAPSAATKGPPGDNAGGGSPTDPGASPANPDLGEDAGGVVVEESPQPGTPQVGSETPADLTPAAEAPYRSRRRMDLDQLAQAMEQVTGGIRWTETQDGAQVDLFQKLGPTLGRPDYLEQVSEDLEPTALFEKFLSDAARSVCYELVERDLSVLPTQRILMGYVDPADTVETNPVGVDANLRVLLMRFHGRNTEPSSPGLVPWRWLFTSSTHVSGDPIVGWRTVCVALITHPDFYSY